MSLKGGRSFSSLYRMQNNRENIKGIRSVQPNPDISQYVCWCSASSSKQVASRDYNLKGGSNTQVNERLCRVSSSHSRNHLNEAEPAVWRGATSTWTRCWEPNWDQTQFLILGKWARVQGNIFSWLVKGVTKKNTLKYHDDQINELGPTVTAQLKCM